MLSLVKRFVPTFAAAVLGGLTVWALGGSEKPAIPTITTPAAALFGAPAANLAEVTELPAAARLRLGGYVEARNSVHLTAQMPGRVIYVAGQEGEHVSAGQLVVALDDEALRPEYRAAWANLAGEMSDTTNAQTQLYNNIYGRPASPLGGPGYDAYERMAVPFYNMAQSMFGGMMPGTSGASPYGPMMTTEQQRHSPSAISNARADYERRLAGLAGAQSRIDSLDAKVRDFRAIAPWPAVIVKKYIHAGDVVQPGQPLVDLATPDALNFRIEVPVSQISNLNRGDLVPVSLNGENLWAQVGQIFPVADGAQRTVTVKLALPPGTRAAPGMYGVAWLAQPGGGSPQALAPAVPQAAIAYRGSLPVAYTVNAQGMVEMRILRLGDSQGDRVAVLSGLSKGERVVLNPAPSLKSGEAYSPAPLMPEIVTGKP